MCIREDGLINNFFLKKKRKRCHLAMVAPLVDVVALTVKLLSLTVRVEGVDHQVTICKDNN